MEQKTPPELYLILKTTVTIDGVNYFSLDRDLIYSFSCLVAAKRATGRGRLEGDGSEASHIRTTETNKMFAQLGDAVILLCSGLELVFLVSHVCV